MIFFRPTIILFLTVLSLSLVSSNGYSATGTKATFFKMMATAYELDDDLGLRVAIKEAAKFDLSEDEWSRVRRYIHRQPTVGHDLLFKWDEYGIRKGYKILNAGLKLNNILLNADRNMLIGKFEDAFASYQKVAKFLKKELKHSKSENLILYQTTVHNMARALFGAKRFTDALEVYGWLDQDYPKIRQVIFEKMWTAFKLGKIDLALGTIASQKSSYFSKFMEPESYLLLIYILKQLCRHEDLAEVRKEIEEFIKALRTKQDLGYEIWAKSDIETFSLLKLSSAGVNPDDSALLANLKKAEQHRIRAVLQKSYLVDIKRIEQNLTKILAYTNIAIGSKNKIQIEHNKEDQDEMLDKGYEFWPNTDTEDWVDEIGNHVYMGESKCEKQ